MADQQRYARRVAEAIIRAGRPARSRPLPHGVHGQERPALGVSLREVIDDSERDVRAIEQLRRRAEDEPALHALAEEILGNARDTWTFSRK